MAGGAPTGKGQRVPRRYDNTRRRERALDTQRRIVEGTRTLILERGYRGTNVAAIADRAEVSVDTVYKTYGSKAGVVKALWDATLVGDHEPVAVADRPATKALADEPDPRAKLRLYASMARGVFERLGPLLAALRGTWESHDDLVQLRATLDKERLRGTGILARHLAEVGALAPSLDWKRARDLVWTYVSAEVYLLLVHDRRWSLDSYEQWLANALMATLLAED